MRRILTFAAFAAVFGWLAFQSIRGAENRRGAVLKWAFTSLICALLGWYVWPMAGEGGQTSFSAISLTVALGLVLLIIWRQEVIFVLARPFTSLYDGGGVELEACPLYSIAQAKQKRGLYQEALLEIENQLARFPTDFEGQMLQAQIQAENLHDLGAATETIQHLCAQPGHAAKNIAFALYSLADWQLRQGANQPAARAALEQVIASLPDTEFALNAAQRIAHLGNPSMALPPGERQKYTVTQTDRHFGVRNEPKPQQPGEQEPAERAADLVKHLEQHPLDTDARELLAGIYAEHYHRLDLAADQLEQMIQQPKRPHKLVVRWLNMLADLQVRCGETYDTVRQTLQRIIDLDPKASAAEQARNRLALLKLEFKGQQQKDAVKMGTYEQRLGLKGVRPAK